VHDTWSREQQDRHEIERVIYRWAYAVDQRRPEDTEALFTTDAAVTFGPRESSVALDGWAQYYAMMREAISTEPVTDSSLIRHRTAMCTHHFSNLMVDFESSDEAVAHYYVFALAISHSGARRETWSHVTDRLVRRTDSWRISARVYETVAERS
jgi:ketosteroid isomerase-like protein